MDIGGSTGGRTRKILDNYVIPSYEHFPHRLGRCAHHGASQPVASVTGAHTTVLLSLCLPAYP